MLQGKLSKNMEIQESVWWFTIGTSETKTSFICETLFDYIEYRANASTLLGANFGNESMATAGGLRHATQNFLVPRWGGFKVVYDSKSNSFQLNVLTDQKMVNTSLFTNVLRFLNDG